MRDFDPGDVILWLLPHTGAGFDGAEVTTDLSKNKSRLIAARCGAAKEREITRVEREGTEVPQERGSFEDTPSLVFLFSHGARTSLGVVGGCAMDADFHISDMVGVSRYHLAITFDAQNRPILRDLGSTSGTKLTYNGEKGYRLSNFDWPLVGPSIANGRPPILNITDQIQFKVILPSRDYTSPGHIERVARFRAGTEDPENQLASLIIQSGQSTKLPSKQDTPSRSLDSHPQFYKEVIGKGSFGIVVYFWSFSDREEFVVKQPLPKLIKDRNFSETTWRKEADIMRSISHEHIVAFRDASFSPYPRLEFEYVQGGSLDKYTLSTFESTQILCQLSSALEYLHSRNPPIGHRDIKPENILVASKREVGGIYVKFADFGLSKAGDVLKTCCGTMMWAAPELYIKFADPIGASEDTYGVAVDIWSLGAVVASLESGRPDWEEEWETDAAARIFALQNHVHQSYVDQKNELLFLIIDTMLIEDPDERSSADHVKTEAAKLLQSMVNQSDEERSTTPRIPILSAQALDRNSEGTDLIDHGENREWLDVQDPVSRQTQVLKTTEVASQVSGSLWHSKTPEAASFATGVGNTEAARREGDPQGKQDSSFLVAGLPLGGERAPEDVDRAFVSASKETRSLRKRSLHTINHRTSTSPRSTGQHSTVSQGSQDHKRSRRDVVRSARS